MAPADVHARVAGDPPAAHPARGGQAEADAAGFAHACANCRTSLVGAYCHACGQPAHVHRTAGALLHDLGHGVFHFEGTVWRTLPLLLWRPGELTRRYVAGERARFVSPMALYLFSVFVMFTVLGLGWHYREAPERPLPAGVAPRAIQAPPTVPVPVPSSAAVTTLARASLRIDGDEATLGGRPVSRDRAAQEVLGDMRTGVPRLDAAVRRAYADPEFALYKVKSAAYKYSWVLIPLSLPFMWLLFPFSRRFGLYDHAIFVTYSLSFVTLLFVALSGLGWLGLPGNPLFLAALGLIPVHLFRQLRGAYGLGRAGAAWRLAALLACMLVVLLLFAALLAWLGLL